MSEKQKIKAVKMAKGIYEMLINYFNEKPMPRKESDPIIAALNTVEECEDSYFEKLTTKGKN